MLDLQRRRTESQTGEIGSLRAARERIAKRVGMLTPSSNTVLEPVCSAMVAGLPELSVHFARFRVTEISLSPEALGQFAPDGMLTAARMLADARVDVICWNGTSASWLGLESDRTLCRIIEEETGIAATSSVLAMVEVLRHAGVTRVGLVTPYIERVQAEIVKTLALESLEVVAERHAGLQDNFAFATVSSDDLDAMLRGVAAAEPQAILVLCTNMRGAPLVEAIERETGILVLDSVATAVLGALGLIDIAPARVVGWGRVFTGFSRPSQGGAT